MYAELTQWKSVRSMDKKPCDNNLNGCVVIDPHGELVDTVLSKISSKREDVFVLDPSDMGYPFGMNLLEISTNDPLRRELEKVLVVDAYITVMKRVFGEASIGANTDDLFRNANLRLDKVIYLE